MYESLHAAAIRMETSTLIGELDVAGHVASARAARRAHLVGRITEPVARMFSRKGTGPVGTGSPVAAAR